jgi:hypothetical protein
MTERIRIPYRDRNQPLDAEAVSDLPRALAGDERTVARQLLMDARGGGALTVGQALDDLERATPAQRRTRLDRARADAGLPTLGALEEQRSRAAANRWPPPPPQTELQRDEQGKAIQTCAAPGCEAVSSTREGALQPVAARRWHCEEHRGQAEPGDMEPFEEVVRVDRFGMPLPRPEVEEYYGRLYAQMEHEHQLAVAQRDADAERLAQVEAEYRSGLEAPAGFRPPNYERGSD